MLLLFYVIGGAYMEYKHFPVGHETSIALIFGLIVSALILLIEGIPTEDNPGGI
jgi:hypothetical protein